ncbi:ANKRD44 [Symbiodinium microadriaticum]|nr:ANKRD44 [Symbiodinium microadriaticum]
MACCVAGKRATPLEIYAKSLPDDADAFPALFPMYTVSSDILLSMTKIEPHEKLKARGQLVAFTDDLGRAAFVSHQWLAKQHPDPHFRQMSILQTALKRILSTRGFLPLDFVTEALVRTAKPVPTQDFQEQPLFFWYDYFSCPQLEHRFFNSDEVDSLQQASAIKSIPAYVSKCRFFLALCPVIECPNENKVLTTATWSSRGWCRLERAARELSTDTSWLLIQSDTYIQVVGSVTSLPSGTVGEGEFSKAEDRQSLAPVMRHILEQKLKHCLRVGDLPGFRRYYNLQTVHLRGLEIAPVRGFLPSAVGADAVQEFLHQNGLQSVNKADTAGCWPLHYAALAGNMEVLRGLLEMRADVNRRTSKDEPILGFPPYMSALEMAVFFKRNEAAELLLASRASVSGVIGPPVTVAATNGNVEGIRLLCAAKGMPLARDVFGSCSLESAAAWGSRVAVEELVLQGRPTSLQLSLALWSATVFRGGSAELVQRLIGLRADINFQFNLSRDYNLVARGFYGVQALRHRLGRRTPLTIHGSHMNGSTPLMQAIRTAQFEAAAALIAAGARLDLCNGRNWVAAEFARGQSIPRFLQLGLEGDASECRRVSSLAVVGESFDVIIQELV